MYATAFNTTETSLVIDAEGRTIGGGAFGTVDTTADEVKELQEAGALRVYPELDKGPGQADAAIAAIEATETIRDRAKSLKAASKERLAKIAGDAGFNSTDLSKDELVTRLAFRTEFDFKEALEALKADEKDEPDEEPEETPEPETTPGG